MRARAKLFKDANRSSSPVPADRNVKKGCKPIRAEAGGK